MGIDICVLATSLPLGGWIPDESKRFAGRKLRFTKPLYSAKMRDRWSRASLFYAGAQSDARPGRLVRQKAEEIRYFPNVGTTTNLQEREKLPFRSSFRAVPSAYHPSP